MKTIKEIREATGLSQSKFCGALNIPIRSLQKWEIGERSCPEYVVELIEYRVAHDPRFKKNAQEVGIYLIYEDSPDDSCHVYGYIEGTEKEADAYCEACNKKKERWENQAEWWNLERLN